MIAEYEGSIGESRMYNGDAAEQRKLIPLPHRDSTTIMSDLLHIGSHLDTSLSKSD